MSEAIFSSKGQLTIPLELRQRAHVKKGTKVDVKLVNGSFIVTPKRMEPMHHKMEVKTDPETGFPYFDVPKDAPKITPDEVARILADFP